MRGGHNLTHCQLPQHASIDCDEGLSQVLKSSSRQTAILWERNGMKRLECVVNLLELKDSVHSDVVVDTIDPVANTQIV